MFEPSKTGWSWNYYLQGRDVSIEYCLHEYHTEKAHFLIAFMDMEAQAHWQESIRTMIMKHPKLWLRC
jgi:hypothetical protein